MIFLYLLIFCVTSTFGVNETELENFRKDLLLNLATGIPFNIPSMQLQNAVSESADDDVKYYLYNRNKPRNSLDISNDIRSVNGQLPVKMLIHGWTEHYYTDWCRNLTAAYLQKGKYNIIVLDWSKRGDSDYVTASLSVKSVGYSIGDFITEKLNKRKKIPLSNIHLISHSLGAHVAAMVGKRIVEVTAKKISRITALDPAAPIFDMFTMGKQDRLSADDADFVDIVHTDGGVLGFKNSIGVADFYPNGGTAVQPGCSLLKSDVKYQDLFCSHATSHRYFLKSVLDTNMTAIPCDSWERFNIGNCDKNAKITFGDDVPRNASGNYFFKTPDEFLGL